MTRQQEYEAPPDPDLPYNDSDPVFIPLGADCLSWPDQPLYLQFPFPDPFLSVEHAS